MTPESPEDRERPTGALPPIEPPAGWYSDPDPTTTGQRWWDGYRWTEHRVPGRPPMMPAGATHAGFSTRLYSGEADRSAGTNTAAIWSLVTGISGIVLVLFAWWLGVAGCVGALIWGQIGLGRARRYGVGYGMSIAGVVLGSVAAILVILRIGTFGI